MSAGMYSKRLVGASALLLYGYASYPIVAPTSTHSLRLAQGLDAYELDSNDCFAIHVRDIAARVGVNNPKRISIRVGMQSPGASMGTNLTIGQHGACMVLPMELYDAFYERPNLHKTKDILKRDEIDFVLAHESAHIAKNHSMYSAAFLPASLAGSYVAIHRIPKKMIAGTVGALIIVVGHMYLSWSLEHEADEIAAKNGLACGGIRFFERKLIRNCEIRSALHTRMITKSGNYLGDTSHPLLTSRIKRLKYMI